MSSQCDGASAGPLAVPAGWVLIAFEDVCEPVPDGGRKVPQKAYLPSGLYPIVDQGDGLIGGFTDDASMLFQGETPIIVFGDHTRRFKLIERPFVIGADGVKLIRPTHAWNVRCLWYFLQALKFEDRGYSRHFQFVRKAQLPLPPIAEQARIVDALDELLSDLDAAVAALERVRGKLKVYRAAVLKAAMEGELTAEWRKQQPQAEPASELLKRILIERRRRWEENELHQFKKKGRVPPKNWKAKYKEPAAPDVADLPPLPDGWCWATVEQLSILVTDGDHNPPKRVSSGVPHLTAKNVKGLALNQSGCSYISSRDAERVFHRYRPLAGDLIITCVGTVGRTAIVPLDFKFSPDRNLAALRFSKVGPLGRYLQFYLESPCAQSEIMTASGSTAQPHFYLGDLRALPIALPLLSEQEAVVEAVEDQLSAIDHLESDIDAKLKAAQGLRQSILLHAFSGQLVAQDPNDEPASKLLKRIAVEREQRTSEAAAIRLNSRKPRPIPKPLGKAPHSSTKESQYGCIADR
jgi:type I restriction enzyme S subunit